MSPSPYAAPAPAAPALPLLSAVSLPFLDPSIASEVYRAEHPAGGRPEPGNDTPRAVG